MAFIELGMDLLEENDLTASLAVSNKAVEQHPFYTEAHFYRSVVLLRQKRFTLALAACDRATQLDPNFSELQDLHDSILAGAKR